MGISPKLLPGIISVNLAQGARTMAAEGVVVRRLNTIENFGSMDVLCSDKTGTLTEGSIRLDEAVDPDGNPSLEVLRIALTNARFQTGSENPLDEAIRATAAPYNLDAADRLRSPRPSPSLPRLSVTGRR